MIVYCRLDVLRLFEDFTGVSSSCELEQECMNRGGLTVSSGRVRPAERRYGSNLK
jgi:hypothetical protein